MGYYVPVVQYTKSGKPVYGQATQQQQQAMSSGGASISQAYQGKPLNIVVTPINPSNASEGVRLATQADIQAAKDTASVKNALQADIVFSQKAQEKLISQRMANIQLVRQSEIAEQRNTVMVSQATMNRIRTLESKGEFKRVQDEMDKERGEPLLNYLKSDKLKYSGPYENYKEIQGPQPRKDIFTKLENSSFVKWQKEFDIGFGGTARGMVTQPLKIFYGPNYGGKTPQIFGKEFGSQLDTTFKFQTIKERAFTYGSVGLLAIAPAFGSLGNFGLVATQAPIVGYKTAEAVSTGSPRSYGEATAYAGLFGLGVSTLKTQTKKYGEPYVYGASKSELFQARVVETPTEARYVIGQTGKVRIRQNIYSENRLFGIKLSNKQSSITRTVGLQSKGFSIEDLQTGTISNRQVGKIYSPGKTVDVVVQQQSYAQSKEGTIFETKAFTPESTVYGKSNLIQKDNTLIEIGKSTSYTGLKTKGTKFISTINRVEKLNLGGFEVNYLESSPTQKFNTISYSLKAIKSQYNNLNKFKPIEYSKFEEAKVDLNYLIGEGKGLREINIFKTSKSNEAGLTTAQKTSELKFAPEQAARTAVKLYGPIKSGTSTTSLESGFNLPQFTASITEQEKILNPYGLGKEDMQYKTNLRLNQENIPNIYSRELNKQNIFPKEISRFKLFPSEVSMPKSITEQISMTKSITIPKLLNEQISMPKSITEQISMTKSITIPKSMTSALTIQETPIQEPYPFLLGSDNKSKKKKKVSKGFLVFTRKQGKEVQLSQAPMPYFNALNFGAEEALGTARASFYLKPAGYVEEKSDTNSFYYAEKFRKPIGRSNLPENAFVQLNKFRISSPGEKKEITYKGMLARRGLAF